MVFFLKGEFFFFGCLESGLSGKDFAATKSVYMLTEKAENFTEHSLSTLPTLVYNSRSLEQHWNPFHDLTKPYTCALRAIPIVEAVEWVPMLLKRPKILTKLYKLLKEYYVKFSAVWSTSRLFLVPHNPYCSNHCLNTQNLFFFITQKEYHHQTTLLIG